MRSAQTSPISALLLLVISSCQSAPAQADPTLDAVDLRVMVRREAVSQGLPGEIADAVATVESGYQPGVIGDVGEIGLMQILPSTARMLGFSGTTQELADPAVNIRYGVEYLTGAWRRAGGDICTTVMKYRAGHGETRFSQKSVAYCIRVRAILASQGYPVQGTVPPATFGEPGLAGASAEAGKRAAPVRSRVNWSAYDRRIRAIESRISPSDLMIMR